MRVFLTGGTGYLGAEIARALLDADHEVVALVRDKGRAASLLGCGAEVVEGHLEQLKPWDHHLAGCDAVVHSAALVSAWGVDPARFDAINVTAGLAVIERAQSHGITRIVATGSFFALGPANPGEQLDDRALARPISALQRTSDYVRTKAVVARKLLELQASGSPVVQLFPTILLGPGRRTEGNHIAKVFSDIGRKKHPGLVGSGSQRWNLVPVESVAQAHVQALNHATPGSNFVLGGEEWTQARLVRAAAEAFGVKPPLRKLGRRLPLMIGALAEAVSSITRRAPLLTRAEVKLYDVDWAFDSSKAVRDLGYRPASVADTLEETVRWIRDEVWPREAQS